MVSNDLFFKCQKASPQFLLTKNKYLSHWYFCTHPQDCQNLKNVLTFTLHIHFLTRAWALSLWEHCPVVDGLCQVLSLCFPAWGLSFTSRGHQNLDMTQNPWDRESSQLHPLLDGHLGRIMNGWERPSLNMASQMVMANWLLYLTSKLKWKAEIILFLMSSHSVCIPGYSSCHYSKTIPCWPS